MTTDAMNLLDLPNILLMEIFEHLTYDEVSKKRLICRRIDNVCQAVLNGGFNRAVRQHSLAFKRIKALLPRRESERRNHCLARHADILTSIETRISMLSMTYSKYMDMNLCCFIPGRVLDEIFRILKLISLSNKPLRPHEVLQELRDISSMAIEHFDEKIASTLKKSLTEGTTKVVISADGRRLYSPTGSDIGSGGLKSTVVHLGPRPILGGCTNSQCCGTYHQRYTSYISFAPSSTTTLQMGSTSSGTCRSGANLVGMSLSTGPEVSLNGTITCPESRKHASNYKRLKGLYRRGMIKVRRLENMHVQQMRRLNEACKTISGLNSQLFELKKRLEDVDTKNREISANIKQINVGESPGGGGVGSGGANETVAIADANDNDDISARAGAVADRSRIRICQAAGAAGLKRPNSVDRTTTNTTITPTTTTIGPKAKKPKIQT